MKQIIINKTKELLRFVVYILLPLIGGGWVGVSSCTEEPDGSNLFSTDDKTIAELLRDRSELTAFYRILEKCAVRIADEPVFIQVSFAAVLLRPSVKIARKEVE